MKLVQKTKQFIEKLRALPEFQKKVIFVSVLAVAILAMGTFEVFATKRHIDQIRQSLDKVPLPDISFTDQNQNDAFPVDLNQVQSALSEVSPQEQPTTGNP